MNFKSLRVAGLRGFNEEEFIELGDPLIVFDGPNGSGKTSLGEAIEWLLYGRTLKRAKGEELSKREYSGCYRNVHFNGPAAPFVETVIEDLAGKERTIRRELNEDESSSLYLDGTPTTDLREFGLATFYDRPLILQHTLQDFIFMKPKARYEVLSSMLGLEPLIAFRRATESAKTEFRKKLPDRFVQAESRRTLLLTTLRSEPVLAPVAAAIEQGKLAPAKEHLEQVIQGMVPEGTPHEKLLEEIKVTRSKKERAQLDWGRFSATVIAAPAQNGAIKGLSQIDARLSTIGEKLADAVRSGDVSGGPSIDPQRKRFLKLGLDLCSEADPTLCPFCETDSLTPERVREIRISVADSPAGTAAIQEALREVRELKSDISQQAADLARTLPTLATDDERSKLCELVGESQAKPFLATQDALQVQVDAATSDREKLQTARRAIEDALSQGEGSVDGEDLAESAADYSSTVKELPAIVNAYAANYVALDPIIRSRLSSAVEIKKLDRAIAALEEWRDVELADAVRKGEEELQDLIRATRVFIEKKQKEVLGSRDREIRAWYSMLNPSADVEYAGIATSTDNLELRARTFKKMMMAAPNLSTSALNCLGLAIYLACITRKGTPFRTLIIDDPVQSMDDEHTEAFKKQVLTKLLNEGFRVIVLTHMQPLAGDIEGLYRKKGAVRYKLGTYLLSGPSIEWKGPELPRLLDAVKKNKDATNEQYRADAVLNLRKFVERFVKELFMAETGDSISRKYEDRNWPDLKSLLKRCPSFTAADEPKLEDTHTFTSRHLHTDERMPQKVPSAAHINSHYAEMKALLDQYKRALNFS